MQVRRHAEGGPGLLQVLRCARRSEKESKPCTTLCPNALSWVSSIRVHLKVPVQSEAVAISQFQPVLSSAASIAVQVKRRLRGSRAMLITSLRLRASSGSMLAAVQAVPRLLGTHTLFSSSHFMNLCSRSQSRASRVVFTTVSCPATATRLFRAFRPPSAPPCWRDKRQKCTGRALQHVPPSCTLIAVRRCLAGCKLSTCV